MIDTPHSSRLTPPPALTWTHLFPSTATFDCDGAPAWFAGQIAHHLPADPPLSPDGFALEPAQPVHVKIMWDDASAAPTCSRSHDGIVAVNCRRFPVERLHDAGFGYLRHFAAVPNLENARWLVPLDCPAISAAALSLYTPSRRSAKLKRAAVRLAMHARLPIWYRDHLWIAQRHLPPIEASLDPLLHTRHVRWALSSGAPVGARNRKASALVLAPDGQMLAFVKIARSDIARRIALREAGVLERLAQVPALRDSTPRVIFSADVDGDRLLAQTPLPGGPAPIEFTAAHAAFLALLQTPVTVRAAFTATVAQMPTRLLALSMPHPELMETYYRTLPTLQKFDVPITITHGDFAPWNLRRHDGRVGAFDWEYGEPSGLPLMDEIHYRLQSGWLLEDWSAAMAVRCLHALANRRPLGLKPPHVDAISIIYLLDALVRLIGEGYGEEQDVVAWHRDILNRLSPRWTPRKEAAAA
ncbi:MAG TPA: phosphotransferase [Tepidisphaeraceae bacterium]|nr:phosphotransferase [Tepidisphaeraceae bacterium]